MSERHPRQLRIDDQAAARRTRAAENGVDRRRAGVARLHRRRRRARRPVGFFQVFGGGAGSARIVPVLGKPYSIVDPGVVDQAVPVRLARPSDDGRDAEAGHRSRREAGRRSSASACAPARTSSNPLRYKTAKTELEAKFCLPFLMASIALRRKAGIREFTDEFVASAPVQADDAAASTTRLRSGDRGARASTRCEASDRTSS